MTRLRSPLSTGTPTRTQPAVAAARLVNAPPEAEVPVLDGQTSGDLAVEPGGQEPPVPLATVRRSGSVTVRRYHNARSAMPG